MSKCFSVRLFILLSTVVPLKVMAAGMQMPPTVVEAVQVKPENWQESVSATGTLLANQGTLLRAEIDGRITAIHFTSGDSVSQGTALIDINPAILEAQLRSLEAQLKLNEINYSRAQQLYQKRLYPKAEVDKQLAALHSLRADVSGAKAKLAQAKIQAPFAGKVGLSRVNIGDYVTVGKELVSVQALDPMRIDFSLPERYSGKIYPGQRLAIKVANHNGKLFYGQLTGIDTMIDPKTRSIAVRAEVPNREQLLLPGSFAAVTLFLGRGQPVLTIPQQAVVYEQGKAFVFKIVNNKALKMPIALGSRIGDKIIAERGVTANDTIVSAGQLKLHDQAPVMVKPVRG